MFSEHSTPTAISPDAGVRRANVLGVGIHALNMDQALACIDAALSSRHKGYVCVTNVYVVMEAQKNRSLMEVLNRSYLTVPDGRPTVWVGRWQNFRHMDQVGGPDLMLRVCELSVKRGYAHFLYGGGPGVVDNLKAVLLRRCPGLNIVGTYAPPFRPLSDAEVSELTVLTASLKPDIIWVGIGAPKQERFMAEYLDRLDTTLMFGVGAAFDMHNGTIHDAPQWVKRAGFAWLHRLCQEPRRLWKRYLISNSTFLYAIALQLLGIRKYDRSKTT